MSHEPRESNVRLQIRVEDDRTGMHPVTLERAVLDHLYYTCSKDQPSATPLDVYRAVAHTARDRLVHRWMATQRTYYAQDVKRVYYLSAEYLLGRMLHSHLAYLGQVETARELLLKYGLKLGDILEQENDPGLGNGGLGRLAACFLDSMATLQLPGYGYGILYEFGIFHQVIRDGWQVEQGDAWMHYGCDWEIPRHEYTVPVSFYGRVDGYFDEQGRYRARWLDTQQVLGVPHDIPCPGYGNSTVNTLRLWAARATREFNLAVFNDGDYRRAVEEKALTESISKVLYPKDDTPEGRELRLKQQYFFVCCSIHDIIRRYRKQHDRFDQFADKVAIQLNDTHPAIAVAELMRVLVDEEGLTWEEAWEITEATIAYTNHTLLGEALERWPVAMFERLLPRHLQIIYEINKRFLAQVQLAYPEDDARLARMSIIEEGPQKRVRMANLAVVGSHSVNGVAQLHSRLITSDLMPEMAAFWPHKFNNKTNGVTPRRWLLLSNPELAKAITVEIGDGWLTDMERLKELEQRVDNWSFLDQLGAVKRENKRRLAAFLREEIGTAVDPDSLFDVQVKRIHLYKRQLMNCLHIISLYREILDSPNQDRVPRTFLFGGKAAPGYAMAKLHIKLINDVAAVVNNDPAVRGLIRVVFVPNYGVSLAQRIIPAADLSEQISLAGMEASGTGNMKFAMNGALTIGTLDGANIEIRERVGADNFFLFGLTAEQVRTQRQEGYFPSTFIVRNERLRAAIDLIGSGRFSPDDLGRFQPVVDDLWRYDSYLICADFEDYLRAQREVEETYRDPVEWQRRAALNIANTGYFSSDRTIRQYAEEIWGVTPCPVTVR
ncbi:MAG: glycogen/starch/alpha-glucan phosphorylase [Bradymonadales bacterium]|nr:glycogen/starch/alpha-glucan phosphorylase [Bradymonadales bacterium]